MADPEFTRIIDVRHIESKPVELVANEAECAALAKRFGLVSVGHLAATLTLVREADAVVARGRLKAAVVQSCAVSAEDLPASVDEPLSLRFVHVLAEQGGEEDEIELSDEDCDEILYEGERIDLGEAVAQSLALAIDPFAIGPEAEKVRASGLLGEENLSPFAALAALKKD